MPKQSTKDYMKIRDAYISYLRYYKLLNHGSLKGATTFNIFYMYKNYVMRYMEPHRITAHSYK